MNFLWRLGSVWKYYFNHLKYVMLPFQAIFEDFGELENIKRNKYRYHYLFYFLLSALIMIDYGVVFMIYGHDATNPMLQHHVWFRFMPVFFRVQANTIFMIGFPSTLFCNACLYFYKTFPHLKFIPLYQPQNSQKQCFVMPYQSSGLNKISSGLSMKLATFYNVHGKRIKLFIVFIGLEFHSASSFPLVFDTLIRLFRNNELDLPSFRDFFCLITCVLYMSSLFSMILIGGQFMIQNHIIQIKQRHYLDGMKIEHKRILASDSQIVKAKNYKRAYQKWRKFIGKIFDITREIDCFNRFYCRFMTIILIYSGFTACSMLHAVTTKGKDAPILWLIPWVIYGCFGFFLFIFLFNGFSSMTIYLNLEMFTRIRQLQIRLLSGRCLNRMQIVKLDLVNEYKSLLQKCSFRLMNSAVINNKLFVFQIFGFVSVFYLRLVETTRG